MQTDLKSCKHILVVVESNEDPTIPLARAARLCRVLEANMTLFVSYYNAMSGKQYNNMQDNLLQTVQDKQKEIDEILSKWQAKDALNNTIMSWQFKPSEAVAKVLAQGDYDLVLKAPYQQSEFKQLFRSGLDQYFVSECTLPIWLVKPREWDDSTEVLCCVDMADDEHNNQMLNRKILAVGDKLASALDAEMHVVDCFYGEIGSMRIDYNSKRGFKREASIKEKHAEKLKRYISEYALSDDVLHFVEGIPDSALADTAVNIDAEVAIIGNNEDTNYFDEIFGDTAVDLVKTMPCDLLVLKPD